MRGNTASIILRGFFRCPCGKSHTYGGITRTSRCSCGNLLYYVAFPPTKDAQFKALNEAS